MVKYKGRLLRTSAEISVTCSASLIVDGSTSGVHKIPTDTLAQIRYRISGSDADRAVGLGTMGYIDRRGRD